MRPDHRSCMRMHRDFRKIDARYEQFFLVDDQNLTGRLANEPGVVLKQLTLSSLGRGCAVLKVKGKGKSKAKRRRRAVWVLVDSFDHKLVGVLVKANSFSAMVRSLMLVDPLVPERVLADDLASPEESPRI